MHMALARCQFLIPNTHRTRHTRAIMLQILHSHNLRPTHIGYTDVIGSRTSMSMSWVPPEFHTKYTGTGLCSTFDDAPQT